MPSYKTCSVPLCKNTTIKTPDKLFITVPVRPEIRKKWLQSAQRDPTRTSSKSKIYFCEDHFDLPSDMDNYTEYKIMGSVKQIRIKPNRLPSYFQCQIERPKRTPRTVPRPAAVKMQHKSILQELLTDVEPSTSGSTSHPEYKEDNVRWLEVEVEPPEYNVFSPRVKENPPEDTVFSPQVKKEPPEDVFSLQVKEEPPEDNIRSPQVKEEPPEYNIRSARAATTVKEEIHIAPTVLHPVGTHYKLFPCKTEPGEDQPLGNYSSGDLLTKDVVFSGPSESSPTTLNFQHTKPYWCDICSRSFSNKGILTRHMPIHIKQIEYSCEICNKSFSIKRNLSRHMLVHTKQKAYSCEVCKRSFTLKQHLTNHILYVHNKYKPHCCDVCRRCFARKNDFSKHMLIHNKQNSHSCKVCYKRFARKIHLKKHQLIHSKE